MRQGMAVQQQTQRERPGLRVRCVHRACRTDELNLPCAEKKSNPVLWAVINRGRPLGAERFREQMEAAVGRRVLVHKQGSTRAIVDAPLPGQMGLDL